MLSVRNLAKAYPTPHGQKRLFEDLSFDLSAHARLGILGRNGQGKSTLIKILGGVVLPSTGDVRWSGRASWPLGFGGGFQGSLTGIDNIRFIARIYGQPIEAVAEKTEAFAELGEALAQPIKHYSSGMRARLAFGLSLAIEFDCYLIDEIVSVGDEAFRQKCQEELFGRRADRAFVIASHDTAFIQQVCTQALIIEGGRAKLFDDVNEALEVYAGLTAYDDPAFIDVDPISPVYA